MGTGEICSVGGFLSTERVGLGISGLVFLFLERFEVVSWISFESYAVWGCALAGRCIVQGYRVFAFKGKAFWIRFGMGWSSPEDLVI